MKVILNNTSLVFRKADIKNITSEYGPITLGFNPVTNTDSNTTAAVKQDDSYPNLKNYFNEGYNRVKITPKSNVKLIALICSQSGASIVRKPGTWAFDSLILNVEEESENFQTLRFALRYTVNGVDQDVTGMSNNLAEWLDVVLYKE